MVVNGLKVISLKVNSQDASLKRMFYIYLMQNPCS